jgi:hypothetical protein
VLTGQVGAAIFGPVGAREGRIPVVTLLLGSVYGLSARQSRIAAACESASRLDHALFVGLRCRFADDACRNSQSRTAIINTDNRR